ncbi:MAG: helix-turn-helix domain-containing protein [Dehalococcoidia bacterium]|nr:helix-turn-helix domain-containing protein [Dehalococcoidia bacterium]
MPVPIHGEHFYRTAEACELAGISRNTFLRWVREGSFDDVRYRDRKGWRLFTAGEVGRLKTRVNEVTDNATLQDRRGRGVGR